LNGKKSKITQIFVFVFVFYENSKILQNKIAGHEKRWAARKIPTKSTKAYIPFV
jgi:hypothetical protein